MDAADEQRLLHILRAAQGDPATLALVPLDLAFASAPDAERERLRTALLAAAVPHWFDVPFLAALLTTSSDEASDLMAKLQTLTNVEPFPARGEGACNVHEASRLALRKHLRLKHPELWQTYAQRAHAHLATGQETHERIEALYHLFAADDEAAVNACDTLDRDMRQNPETRSALCLALSELKDEGWLIGAALVEVLRAPLWRRSSRGDVSKLEDEAENLLSLAKAYSHSSRVADAYNFLGDVHVVHGKLAKALDCYMESRSICEHLIGNEPSNAEWQHDLSSSLDRLGEHAVTQGNLAEALRYFSKNKSIAEHLATSQPTNTEWQRDLSVSLNNLGDIAIAQGDLVGAFHSYSESKSISENLAASNSTNAKWQRDISVSLNNLGDLALAQGDLAQALRSYSESKAIRERLADSDPTSAEWQRDLSVSLNKLGNLAVAQGDLICAHRNYSESQKIRERLSALDPSNAAWQRDLAVSLNKLGNLAAHQGDLASALLHFSKGKSITERLTASDPSNITWQRDLSVSLDRLGDLAVVQGDLNTAFNCFSESKTIAERLAWSNPTNAEWQRDLWVSYWRLGGLCENLGRHEGAQTWWQLAYNTLAKMNEYGLHLSPQDLGCLVRLRTKFRKGGTAPDKPSA